MTNPLLTINNIHGFDKDGSSKPNSSLQTTHSESSTTPRAPLRCRHSSLSSQRPNELRCSSSVAFRTPNSSTDDTFSVDDDDASTRVLLVVDQNDSNDPTCSVPALHEIHSLCQTASCLGDLQEIMSKITIETASCLDKYGRTPLHVLSENKKLADSIWSYHSLDTPLSPLNIPSSNDGVSWTASFSSPSKSQRRKNHVLFRQKSNVGNHSNKSLSGQSIVRLLNEPMIEMLDLLLIVVETLWRAYPPSMMTTDEQGFIPFEKAIYDWVSSCNKNSSGGYFASVPDYQHSAIRSFVQTVSAPSSMVPSFQQLKSTLTPRWINSSSCYQNHHSTGGSHRSVALSQPSLSVDIEAGKNNSPSSGEASPVTRGNRFSPHRVQVTSPLLLSIKVLSMLLECMNDVISTNFDTKHASSNIQPQKMKRPRSLVDDFKHHTNRDMKLSIVQTVAGTADFLKYSILIEDMVQRNQYLETTLMRHVLLSKHSIRSGKWLTDMLQSEEKWVSDLSIDYLQIVSSTSLDGKMDVIEHTPGHQFSKNSTVRKLYDSHFQIRDEFYLEVSCIENFVPSLLSLGEQQIEEAATTVVVREVLDRIISRPFAVTVVFCDAFFLVLLIVGFRGAVHSVLLGYEQGTVLQYIYIANVGIFYFVIREIGKVISLSTITRRARVYLTFWNLIDFLTTCLALLSTIVIRCGFTELRNLFSITTGFMWLRVLSYLKGINMQLATFVLAILQIAKDLIWFAVILFVVVIMFSQMFFTVLAPNECATSVDIQDSPECSQSEYYLKVYAILLGDFGFFNREDLVTIFSIFLAVFFTFATTTILLNVLIAVSSDSYEKCLIRSHKLFGRARVLMIAELVSLQNLLCRRGMSDPVNTWWNRSISCVHGWSRGSVLFFVLSSFVTITWTVGEVLGSVVGSSYGNVWMSLGSVFVNVVLLCCIVLFLSSGAADGKVSSDEYYKSRYSEWYRRYFQSTMVYCLGSSGNQKNVTGVEHMWQGRILYLREEMEGIASKTKEDCAKMVKSMESQLEQSESRLLSELSQIHTVLQERDAEKIHLLEMMTELLETSRKGRVQ